LRITYNFNTHLMIALSFRLLSPFSDTLETTNSVWQRQRINQDEFDTDRNEIQIKYSYKFTWLRSVAPKPFWSEL